MRVFLPIALLLSGTSVFAQSAPSSPSEPVEAVKASVSAGQRHLMSTYGISAQDAGERLSLEDDVSALAK